MAARDVDHVDISTRACTYALLLDLTAELHLITRTKTWEYHVFSIQLDSNPSTQGNSFSCTFYGSGPGLVSTEWVDLISLRTWQGISLPILSYQLAHNQSQNSLAVLLWCATT